MKQELLSLDLFPLPVFQINNAVTEEQCEDLRKFADTLQYHKNDAFHGYTLDLMEASTDKKILDKLPEYKEYFENLLEDISSEVLQQVGKFSVKTSWFTKAQKGQQSFFHTHKNYYMSGVLYLQEGSAIMFKNPLKVFESYDFYLKQQTAFNCKTTIINPPKNSILFFPAYLEHQIHPWGGSGFRYSLTMNYHPVGEYGTSYSSIELK